jgi:hypothetical protein
MPIAHCFDAGKLCQPLLSLHPNHRIVASPAVLNGEVHQDFELLIISASFAAPGVAAPFRIDQRPDQFIGAGVSTGSGR